MSKKYPYYAHRDERWFVYFKGFNDGISFHLNDDQSLMASSKVFIDEKFFRPITNQKVINKLEKIRFLLQS